MTMLRNRKKKKNHQNRNTAPSIVLGGEMTDREDFEAEVVEAEAEAEVGAEVEVVEAGVEVVEAGVEEAATGV